MTDPADAHPFSLYERALGPASGIPQDHDGGGAGDVHGNQRKHASPPCERGARRVETTARSRLAFELAVASLATTALAE